VTGPATPPPPAELDALLRRMRLPYLRKAAPGKGVIPLAT